MLQKIYKFPASCTTGIIAIGLLISSLIFKVDFFEHILAFLQRSEHIEADEIVLAIIIFLLGISIDLNTQRKKQQIKLMLEYERLHTFKTTVRTVQDLVGNFLNNLLFYKMQLDQSGVLDDHALKEINQLIHATAKKLQRLGEINTVIEKEIVEGIFVIDMDQKNNTVSSQTKPHTPLHTKFSS